MCLFCIMFFVWKWVFVYIYFDISSLSLFICLSLSQTEMNMYKEVCYYMLFALAAYGWPMYLMRKPACGLCRLASSCPWAPRHTNIHTCMHSLYPFASVCLLSPQIGLKFHMRQHLPSGNPLRQYHSSRPTHWHRQGRIKHILIQIASVTLHYISVIISASFLHSLSV